MLRFFLFVPLLTIIGAFFVCFCAIEYLALILPIALSVGAFPAPPTNYSDQIFSDLFDLLKATWFYGAPLGFLIGLGCAAFDLIRNGRQNESSLSRFLPNLFWCSLYALVPILVNSLVSYVGFKLMSINLLITISNQMLFFIGLSVLLALYNLTAILWAVIRSVTTQDVLTPRVLKTKFQRTIRLAHFQSK